MSDPTIVPWGLVWWGLVLAVSGAVLALHTFQQRQTNAVSTLGQWLIAVGLILFLAVPTVNLIGFLASALHHKTQELYAASHSEQSTDH